MKKWIIVSLVVIFFLYPMCFWEQGKLTTFSLTFVAIVFEAFPFMLAGAILSGLVEAFVPPQYFVKILSGKNRIGLILLAGLLGIVLPSCECAIIPLVRRLMKKGLPFSVALAYLLAGPIVNPLVALSTYYAYSFNYEIPIVRVILGYLIAVSIAFVMDRIYPEKTALVADLQDQKMFFKVEKPLHLLSNNQIMTKRSWRMKILSVLKHSREEFFEVSILLIAGAFVASFLQSFIGAQLLREFASNPVVAISFMMLLAIISNICSETDAFVAATFKGTGIPLFAQMSFMVIGPMLDVKLFFMYFKILKKRPIFVLCGLIIGFVFVASLLLSRWFV